MKVEIHFEGWRQVAFRQTPPPFCRLFMRGHAAAGVQGNRVRSPPQALRGDRSLTTES